MASSVSIGWWFLRPLERRKGSVVKFRDRTSSLNGAQGGRKRGVVVGCFASCSVEAGGVVVYRNKVDLYRSYVGNCEVASFRCKSSSAEACREVDEHFRRGKLRLNVVARSGVGRAIPEAME